VLYRAIAMSADGQYLACGMHEHCIAIWNPTTGTQVRTLAQNTDWVVDMAWFANGQCLVSGHENGEIKLWNLKSLVCAYAHCDWKGTPSAPWHLAPHGSGLIVAGRDGSLNVWDLEDWKPPCCTSGTRRRNISYRRVPETAGFLASAGDDSTLRIWDRATGDCMPVLGSRQPMYWLCCNVRGAYHRRRRLWEGGHTRSDFAGFHKRLREKDPTRRG